MCSFHLYSCSFMSLHLPNERRFNQYRFACLPYTRNISLTTYFFSRQFSEQSHKLGLAKSTKAQVLCPYNWTLIFDFYIHFFALSEPMRNQYRDLQFLCLSFELLLHEKDCRFFLESDCSQVWSLIEIIMELDPLQWVWISMGMSGVQICSKVASCNPMDKSGSYESCFRILVLHFRMSWINPYSSWP